MRSLLAANCPSEDAASQIVYESVDGQIRYLFGIFDGHSSGCASQFCQQELFGFIERRLHMLDRAKQRYLETMTDAAQKAQFERVRAIPSSVARLPLINSLGVSRETLSPGGERYHYCVHRC